MGALFPELWHPGGGGRDRVRHLQAIDKRHQWPRSRDDTGAGADGQRNVGRARKKCRTGRLEIGTAELEVGLEVGALRPLVPGVDEDELLLGGLPHAAPDQLLQPGAVELRRRAVEDDRSGVAARGVVPARGQAPIPPVRRLGPRQRLADNLPVVEDPVGRALPRRPAQPGPTQRLTETEPVGRELDGSVEAELTESPPALPPGIALDTTEQRFAHPRPQGLLTKEVGGALGGRQGRGAIDEQERAATDAQVAGIGEDLRQIARVHEVVGLAVLLTYQHFAVPVGPAPGPRFVRPAQTERKIRLATRQDLRERALQQAPTLEPVVVVAESRDAVRARQLGLCGARFGQPEIVEPELARQARLSVAAEARPGSGHIAPFGEAGPPPGVVLWNGMELRQIKGDELHCGRPRPEATPRSEVAMPPSRNAVAWIRARAIAVR